MTQISKEKSKFRSPTSLSIFPEHSPQLQKDEASTLNKFTSKNIQVQDKHGHLWNTVENNKLAYKRSARGAYSGSYPKIIYGPTVERLTADNYKSLKKDTLLYYDRNSVVFRGPFIYQKTLRGPSLLLTAHDIGYIDNTYKFILPVNKLKTEVMYFETFKKKTFKKKTFKKSLNKKSARKKALNKKTFKKSLNKKSSRKKALNKKTVRKEKRKRKNKKVNKRNRSKKSSKN